MCDLVVILYHHSDDYFVKNIVEILEGPFFNLNCCFAGRDIVFPTPVTFCFDFLERCLKTHTKFVVVLSDNFLLSRETQCDLGSFLYRFYQKHCKVVFIENTKCEVDLPYRLAALKKYEQAKFITASEGDGNLVAIAKAISKSFSDGVARVSGFPIHNYRFAFGARDVRETGSSESRRRAVLDVHSSVVTFIAGSPNIIVDEGIQLHYSGQNRADVVVERMKLPAHVMTYVTDANPAAFAPLIPSVRPLYFLAVNPVRSPEDGASGNCKPPQLKAKLQLWFLNNSDPSKNYCVMFSETVNFFGGNWSDVTYSSLFAWNGQAACFELELRKYGVYLLCDVDQTSVEDTAKTCVLQAMSDYLSQNYRRFAALVSYDRRKVTLCSMRPFDDTYLSAVCTTDSHWHRHAFVRLPKSIISGSLEVTLDIKAGWKRTHFPATLDLYMQSDCRTTVPLTDDCNQVKILCSIAEKNGAKKEEITIFEFKYEMASRFQCSPNLKRSFTAPEITQEEPHLRPSCSTSELTRRAKNLLKNVNQPSGEESKSRSPSTPLNSKYSPRSKDSVLMGRLLTSPRLESDI